MQPNTLGEETEEELFGGAAVAEVFGLELFELQCSHDDDLIDVIPDQLLVATLRYRMRDLQSMVGDVIETTQSSSHIVSPYRIANSIYLRHSGGGCL